MLLSARSDEKIEKVLWEGPLVPSAPRADERDLLKKDTVSVRPEDLPEVTIGFPETYTIKQFLDPEPVPAPVKAKMKRNDFYIVRLIYSISSKTIPVTSARFEVMLKPAIDGPIAFDQCPQNVTAPKHVATSAKLEPSLKFGPLVEVSVGSISHGVQYDELEPIVSASGMGTNKPSWDYKSGLGVALKGNKIMHLVLKAPKGMTPINATLKVEAYTIIERKHLHLIPKPSEEPLSPEPMDLDLLKYLA